MAFPTTDTTTSPVTGVIPVALNATVTAGRAFAVIATQPGAVSVLFVDGTTGTYPVSNGLNTFPFAITKVTAAPAGAVLENWK
jgi:Asp/Glu/hydantoin racemase